MGVSWLHGPRCKTLKHPSSNSFENPGACTPVFQLKGLLSAPFLAYRLLSPPRGAQKHAKAGPSFLRILWATHCIGVCLLLVMFSPLLGGAAHPGQLVVQPVPRKSRCNALNLERYTRLSTQYLQTTTQKQRFSEAHEPVYDTQVLGDGSLLSPVHRRVDVKQVLKKLSFVVIQIFHDHLFWHQRTRAVGERLLGCTHKVLSLKLARTRNFPTSAPRDPGSSLKLGSRKGLRHLLETWMLKLAPQQVGLQCIWQVQGNFYAQFTPLLSSLTWWHRSHHNHAQQSLHCQTKNMRSHC